EELPAIRSLTELNRVQPKVAITTELEDPKSGTAKITVEVSEDSRLFDRNGKKVNVKSGVYDLRLFRDGQLVGQYPPEPDTVGASQSSGDEELKEWRAVHRIELDSKTGTRIITFTDIRLPRKEGVKEVQFTAYAFNEDRVKSETARSSFAVPQDLSPRA